MPITTTVSTKKLGDIRADLFIFAVSEKQPLVGLLPKVRADVTAMLRKRDFSGSWGASELFISPAGLTSTYCGVVGLGARKAPLHTQLEGFRRGVAKVVVEGRRQMLRDIVIVLPGEYADMFAAAALESVLLSDYRFDEYQKALRNEQSQRGVRKIIFVVDSSHAKDVKASVERTNAVMDGVTLARGLVNQPASHMSPKVLVDTAQAIVKKSPRTTVSIMDRKKAEKENFSAFLAVARGSEEEPYVIHLVHKPKRKAKKKIFLVGKGITFDSGGLSLKPAASMESMKIDMAGAAVVLGVFAILPHLDLDVEVHGVIAACENMPSGTAYRPGDIVEAKNGKTIEILNTDAEGRVTLADALSYAVEQGADAIVDLATLTGAVVVALGETYAGVWSNREDLQDQLMDAAEVRGEGLVALPMPEEYKSVIRSKVADVRNTATSNPYGGATTAAMFLQEFVGDTPWAHVDIAGPSYFEKPYLPYYSFGGTGYGVRTLVEFLGNID